MRKKNHFSREFIVILGLSAGAAHAQSVIPGPGANGPAGSLLRAAGQTPPQQVTGELIGIICPASPGILGSDLQARCDDIAGAILGSGDVSGALAGLQAMAPEENSAVQTIEVEGSQTEREKLRERLEERRDDDEDDAATSFNVTIDGQRLTNAEILGIERGGGASADPVSAGRLGVYINGNFGIGDKDSTPNETGFDTNSYGVTGGADYLLTDRSIVGVALSYTTQDVDLDSNSGSLDTDGFSVSVYGSYYPSARSYVNVIGTYGATDHEQQRNLIYTIAGTASVVNQTALSDTESDELAGSVEGGYDFYRGQWTLTPYARLDISHTEIDGYTERMSDTTGIGSGLALQIDDQDFTSLTTAFGARATMAVRTAQMDVFPQVGLEYMHEFDNDNEDTTGRLVDDTSQSTFLLPTDKPDRNYGNVSAGVTADFRNGWSGHVLYQGLIGYSDLNLHGFEIGARLQF